jgi:hypothetical protein
MFLIFNKSKDKTDLAIFKKFKIMKLNDQLFAKNWIAKVPVFKVPDFKSFKRIAQSGDIGPELICDDFKQLNRGGACHEAVYEATAGDKKIFVKVPSSDCRDALRKFANRTNAVCSNRPDRLFRNNGY